MPIPKVTDVVNLFNLILVLSEAKRYAYTSIQLAAFVFLHFPNNFMANYFIVCTKNTLAPKGEDL